MISLNHEIFFYAALLILHSPFPLKILSTINLFLSQKGQGTPTLVNICIAGNKDFIIIAIFSSEQGKQSIVLRMYRQKN